MLRVCMSRVGHVVLRVLRVVLRLLRVGALRVGRVGSRFVLHVCVFLLLACSACCVLGVLASSACRVLRVVLPRHGWETVFAARVSVFAFACRGMLAKCVLRVAWHVRPCLIQ